MSERALRVAIVALALFGAAIAGYLTWVHFRPEALVCLSGGGCETVQRSRYAEVAGVPVAAVGVAAYVALAATGAGRGIRAATLGAVVGVAALVFALWLVYVQAALLDAWCNWCLASDAVLALLAPLCVVRVWRAAAPAPA